jgi:hypothetical protein
MGFLGGSMAFLEGYLLFSFMGGLGGMMGFSFSFYLSSLLVKTLLVLMTNFFSSVFSFSGSLMVFSLGFKLAVVCDFLGTSLGFS